MSPQSQNPPSRLRRLPDELAVARAGLRAARLRPAAPRRLVAMGRAAARLRTGAAMPVAALRYGDGVALIDDRGPLTFEDLDRRSNSVANGWRTHGLGDGDGVGIMCRNHRGFLDALNGAMKIGARVVLLNTEFAPPQIADVCSREGVDLIVHDEEFTDVVTMAEFGHSTTLAWTDGEPDPTSGTLDRLIERCSSDVPPRVTQSARVVLLTSGTTGTPKGANRGRPTSLAAAAGMLSMPIRGGESTFVAPPMFHVWGLGHTLMSLSLGSTVVTTRRFDPADVLQSVAEHQCTMLTVVPTMLRRLVDAADPTTDLSALRIIASSGSQLDGALAIEAMDRFGDILYNLYGSTEIATVALATPEDLRAAPGCAGRPARGVFVQLLDDQGLPATDGATGRIFVSNGAGFGGYTGGGTKEVIRGMMSSGDVGHFDGDGRLFIDGRDDEMIVSGGENVFPREIEELLAGHPAIVEAAAIGVPDEDFGARLRAFVVRRPGADLDADAVRDHVRQHLARFKAPRDVVFIDELPRNPAGKVLKRVLVETAGSR